MQRDCCGVRRGVITPSIASGEASAAPGCKARQTVRYECLGAQRDGVYFVGAPGANKMDLGEKLCSQKSILKGESEVKS